MLAAIIFAIDGLLIIGYIVLRIIVKRRERKLHAEIKGQADQK